MTDNTGRFLITGATGKTGAHTVSCFANAIFVCARSCTISMTARRGWPSSAPKLSTATYRTLTRSARR